jgi:hypothetical protein
MRTEHRFRREPHLCCIALREAAINDAKPARDEEDARKASRLLGMLRRQIVDTQELLWEFTEPSSVQESRRRHRSDD